MEQISKTTREAIHSHCVLVKLASIAQMHAVRLMKPGLSHQQALEQTRAAYLELKDYLVQLDDTE